MYSSRRSRLASVIGVVTVASMQANSPIILIVLHPVLPAQTYGFRRRHRGERSSVMKAIWRKSEVEEYRK